MNNSKYFFLKLIKLHIVHIVKALSFFLNISQESMTISKFIHLTYIWARFHISIVYIQQYKDSSSNIKIHFPVRFQFTQIRCYTVANVVLSFLYENNASDFYTKTHTFSLKNRYIVTQINISTDILF